MNHSNRYNPEIGPDPKWCLELDESERIRLVSASHQVVELDPGAERLHAMLHVVIENQLALGEPVVVLQALTRLLKSGLTRHDAIHAIASVLAEHLYNSVQSSAAGSTKSFPAAYEAAVAELTVGKWRDGLHFAGADA